MLGIPAVSLPLLSIEGLQSKMVPGKMHCKMNMYLAVCRVAEDKTRYDIIGKYSMVDPKEC